MTEVHVVHSLGRSAGLMVVNIFCFIWETSFFHKFDYLIDFFHLCMVPANSNALKVSSELLQIFVTGRCKLNQLLNSVFLNVCL